MEVILLEKIHKLGELGDQVRVKPGFGRNYLVPQGKAVPATPENIAGFSARRAELEKQQQETLSAATERAERLNGMGVSIARKAGSEGKLFGSVGTIDVAEAVTEAGTELAKHEVRLPAGPIRSTGEYELTVQLQADVSAIIKLTVVAEEST